MDRLYEEIAYIAYHLHWSRNEIMGLEHRERHLWVEEVARVNKRLNDAMKQEGS